MKAGYLSGFFFRCIRRTVRLLPERRHRGWDYIQEMTDNIKRNITPEDASKMINKVKDTRTGGDVLHLAYIEISRCVDDMYQTRLYGGLAGQLSNEAAKLSFYAAVLSFEASKAAASNEKKRRG
jgi:hypothetical protein